MKDKVVLVFSTTHLTLKAEEIFKKKKIPNMIIPKPEDAKSKCGVAIKIYEEDLSRAMGVLEKEKIDEVTVLKNL